MNGINGTIGKKINQLFIGAACIAFPVTLVIACILLRVDNKDNEYRTTERIKALLEAQLPLLASDLSHASANAISSRLDILIATQSPVAMEAAVFDKYGKLLTASDGFSAVLGVSNETPHSGDYVTPEGYAVSVRTIQSGLDTLGSATFLMKLQHQSSKLIGQSLAASLFVLALVLLALFIATQRYLMRTIVRPIEKLINELPALSGFLEHRDDTLPPAPTFDSEELKSLSRALWNTHAQLKETLQKEEALRLLSTEKEASLRISKQVAHDIRSPLSALDVTVETMHGIEENKRLLVRRIVSRIHDITNNLRRAGRPVCLGMARSQEATTELLSGILEPLASEKRAEFAKRSELTLDLYIMEGAHGIFSHVSSCDLQRILSNLINNSAEAIESPTGSIKIALSSEKNAAVIRILDNGKGIPPDVLRDLGSVERTFGKEEGSGQGIFPAKETIETWGGTLSISSEIGRGTCVEIRLPVVAPPSWFVDTIEIPTKVAILDDDPTIHGVWDERFRDLGLDQSGIQVFHFYDPATFEKWFRAHSDENALCLMDYHLIGHKESGLDVIERLRIARQSILITSHYDEPNLLERCLKLSVRLLPKSIAGFIPIRKDLMAEAIALKSGTSLGVSPFIGVNP